jgi:APA family basic amino acid/polyamine antiporter
VAPAVYIVVGTAILALAFLQRPVESLVAIGTALAGIPVYWLFKRGAARAR